MPPLSTHFRFADLILSHLVAAPHVAVFLLATVAPDSFQPDDQAGFNRHHFIDSKGRIDLAQFRASTGFSPDAPATPDSTFLTAYYAHLWLDVFFQDHGKDLPIARPPAISDAEFRQALRIQADFLNAPSVLALCSVVQPVPQTFDPPFGVEFIDMRRCAWLQQRVVEQAQVAATGQLGLEVLHEIEYTGFLQRSADSFLGEAKAAACR